MDRGRGHSGRRRKRCAAPQRRSTQNAAGRALAWRLDDQAAPAKPAVGFISGRAMESHHMARAVTVSPGILPLSLLPARPR